MKLINCLNLELSRNDQGIYSFNVGTTKVYVHNQLVETRKVKKGIKIFAKTQYRYFLNVNLEVDVRKTSQNSIAIVPYDAGNVMYDLEYLVFLSVLRTAEPKIMRATMIIDSGAEHGSMFSEFFKVYMFACSSNVVISRQYRTLGGKLLDEPLGIINGRLTDITVDKELEEIING